MPFISPHISQQKIPAALLNTLQRHYSLILILSLSISRKYIYLTALISKYLNTSPYSSLTKSFLLKSNLYNFSSGYNLTFLLFLTSIPLTLPQKLHPTKHPYLLPSPHFSRDIKHSYQKPFSWKA